MILLELNALTFLGGEGGEVKCSSILGWKRDLKALDFRFDGP